MIFDVLGENYNIKDCSFPLLKLRLELEVGLGFEFILDPTVEIS